jgi:hypothetical protein
MSMTRATVEVGLKAAQLKETATVAGHRMLEFYASAFTGKADRNGDIMDPKAFDKWLPEFYAAAVAADLNNRRDHRWHRPDQRRAYACRRRSRLGR